MSKELRYMRSEFDDIILKETREYKAYELGHVHGIFNTYLYIEEITDKKTAMKIFQDIMDQDDNIGRTLTKLIELHNQPNDKINDLLDMREKYEATKYKD